jgi:hypothetical protein
MRTKKLLKLPKCDFCSNEAMFDAPMIGVGSWAYACFDCSRRLALDFGTKLVLKDKVNPTNTGEIVDGIEDDSEEYFNSLLFDEMREIGCPLCGESQTMEVDAVQYTCSCGATVKMQYIC